MKKHVVLLATIALAAGCGSAEGSNPEQISDGVTDRFTLSNNALPGIGTAIPPITSSLIVLRITGNTLLTEVAVGKKTTLPITGRYDSVAKTANVKILATDFQNLSNAVSGGGQVSIQYTYRDPDGQVVGFSWQPY